LVYGYPFAKSDLRLHGLSALQLYNDGFSAGFAEQNVHNYAGLLPYRLFDQLAD